MHSLNSCALLERIGRAVRDFGGKIAVSSDGSGKAISYAQLWQSAEQLRKGLLGDKFRQKTVGINVEDPIQFTTSLLACWMNESIAVPLHYSYPKGEIEHRISTTQAACTLLQSGSTLKRIDHPCNASLSLPADANLILFTSGSTGKPKGVLHTSTSLMHQLTDLQNAWQMTPSDRLLHTLPLNHIHGLVTGLLNSLWMGASITVHSKFDAECILRTLEAEKISFFTAVPTIYSKLAVTLQSEKFEHSLRAAISGSSALSARLKEAFTARGLNITERYGMTETGMITSNAIGRVTGTVGKALPSISLKAEMSGIGDIYVKGPGLFAGYLRDGRFEPHNRDDYFRTGDQGFLAEDGNLRLSGRDRDIFKVAGFKVAAGEIEAALGEHVAVLECVACALKASERDDSSQVIGMLVRVKPGIAVTKDQLKEYLAANLAYYKLPRRWILTEGEIPRNLIGKPDLRVIQAMFTLK